MSLGSRKSLWETALILFLGISGWAGGAFDLANTCAYLSFAPTPRICHGQPLTIAGSLLSCHCRAGSGPTASRVTWQSIQPMRERSAWNHEERVKRILFPLGAGGCDCRRGGKAWNPAWFGLCKPTPVVCKSVCVHWAGSSPSLLQLAQGSLVKKGLCTTSAQGCLRDLNWNWILCFTDWYQKVKKKILLFEARGVFQGGFSDMIKKIYQIIETTESDLIVA